MIKGDKLSGVNLCREIGSVVNIFMHPRHYTCLLQTDKSLVYYDLFALNTTWTCDQSAVNKTWLSPDPYRVAFTYDFNSVYIVTNEHIHWFNCSESLIKLTTSRIGFTDRQEVAPLFLIVEEDKYILVYDTIMIIQAKADWQKVNIVPLGEVLQQGVHIFSLSNQDETTFIGHTETSVIMYRANVTLDTINKLSRLEVKQPILSLRLDEQHKKTAVLTESLIQIFTYGEQGLERFQVIEYGYPIMDFLFFHFAQNTDTVEQRHQQELLMTATLTSAEGCKLGIYTLPSSEPQMLNLPRHTRNIMFNPLFNNCLILLNSHGQLTLENLYGYDKEWVTLGFRFVSIESNQTYFEKQNEFEFELNKKTKSITVQDLDDDSYSLFTQGELKKLKRISFEI